MTWTAEDLVSATQKNIPESELCRQLALLNIGGSESKLAAPCTLQDGVCTVNDADAERYKSAFVSAMRANQRVVRFVPASGAATRMFAPIAAPDEYAGEAQAILEQFDQFAFANAFVQRAGSEWGRASNDERLKLLQDVLLSKEGLDFDQLPKGAIPFHRYPDEVRTAFEEQLHEAAMVAGPNTSTEVHFTVPPSFSVSDRSNLSQRAHEIGRAHQCVLTCTFSEQLSSTDTIALDENGAPFRNQDGALLFRPGGHGALLHNLAQVSADLIYIKNIDNVLPDRLKHVDAESKRMLGGLLLTLKSQRDELLHALDSAEEGAVAAASEFAAHWFVRDGDALPGGWQAAKTFLDRPMRVCGMVQNEGQPGGGPFWLADCKFKTSVQIVERAQLTLSDSQQRAIFEASTHFNPVDMVCAVNDPAGRPYDLKKFVNPNRVFLAEKTHDSRFLRALEHPGLWNGGMEDWLTVFVEVDPATFAPVKTVADLLRPEHQA